MKRIEAVEELSKHTSPEDLFVSSVGALVDDWWNFRPGSVDNTFSACILGSVSSTALGLSLALPHRRVMALETDGSVLMNTGVMCTLGNERPSNLTILVFDNGIHESIGGAPTHTSGASDLAHMAEGAGCINTVTVATSAELSTALSEQLNDEEFGYIVAKIEPGVRRWKKSKTKPTDGVEDKYRFIRYIEALEGIIVHPGAIHSGVDPL